MGLVRINPHLTVGGVPTEAGLRQLFGEGLRGALDLRLPEEAPGAASPQLADILQRQGIEYRCLPVAIGQIDPATGDQFCSELRRLPTPSLVFSEQGSRAAALTIMYLAAANGWSGDYALSQSQRIGLRLAEPSYVDAVKAYADSRLAPVAGG